MLVFVFLLFLQSISAGVLDKFESECLETKHEFAKESRFITPTLLKFHIMSSPKEIPEYIISDKLKECDFFECIIKKMGENGFDESSVHETILEHYKDTNMDKHHLRKCIEYALSPNPGEEGKNDKHIINVNGDSEVLYAGQ